MYSYQYIENNKIKSDYKAKGISKVCTLNHDEYKTVLFEESKTYNEFYNIRLSKQKIYLDKTSKVSLTPYDNKRYWLSNTESVPYGYNKL